VRVFGKGVGVDLRRWWERDEVGIFPSDGSESDVRVLEVRSGVAFEGLHSVPVEGVVANPG